MAAILHDAGFGGVPYPTHPRRPNPYESVLANVAAGADEFPFEKEAQEIESRLLAASAGEPLPLAPGFKGASPMPLRYHALDSGLSEAQFSPSGDFHDGLARWVASLGRVRRASFFVLPDRIIRYEVASENGYRVGLWKQVWKDGRLLEFEPFQETLATASEPFFEDITGYCFRECPSFEQQLLKGNTWWRSRLDSATGIDLYGNNGLAIGDIDGDGLDEIYVCQSGGLPNRLHKNRGDGTLIDITKEAGVAVLDETSCALFADFRNSGAQDLVVLTSGGPLLFLNDGKGKFTHLPGAFRFRAEPQGSFTGMAAADYNRDGRVDLYLCCYVYYQSEDQYRYAVPYHNAQNGPPNFLFRNRLAETDPRFEDVTQDTGLDQNNNRYSFAPAWCDLDSDGWPDLFVANDFGKSNLYRNNGGKFRDEAEAAGVENNAPGMSAAWFDYDGDGRPDLYVSNMWTAAGQRIVHDPAFAPGKTLQAAYHSHTNGSSLYRNLGNGKFSRMAEEGSMGRWGWCADGIDFDNDGSPEILGTAGMLTNASTSDLESFFWRQVVAKSPVSEASAPAYENGWNALNQLIREDYSWCGREPNVYYKRIAGRFRDFSGVSGLDFAEDSRAFAVTDVDQDGNLDVVLKSRLAPQVRILRNRCGVGKRSIAFRLRGVKSNRDAIGARIEVNGQVKYLNAGSGYLSQHSKTVHFGLGETATAHVKITWPSGLRQDIRTLAAEGTYEIVEGSSDTTFKPFLPRGAIASPAVAGVNQAEFAATWLLEPVPLPDIRKGPGFLLLTAGAPGPLPGFIPIEAIDVTHASPDLAAQYSIFRRYLFELRTDLELPLVLLIDDRSRAHKIYSELPPAGVLQSDLSTLLHARKPELALPFAGQYYTFPQRNHFKLGAAFYWAGYPDQAIPHLEATVAQSPDNLRALIAIAQIHFERERWQPALDSFDRVLALREGDFDALLGAGEASLKLRRFPEAQKYLERAFAADNRSADGANQLGLALVNQGQRGQAKEWFLGAISIDPKHVRAINNLAVLYTELGQTNDAIAAFLHGIEIAPVDDELYLNLGRLYLQTGQPERARTLMLQLLDRKPDSVVARRALREMDSK